MSVCAAGIRVALPAKCEGMSYSAACKFLIYEGYLTHRRSRRAFGEILRRADHLVKVARNLRPRETDHLPFRAYERLARSRYCRESH